MFLKTCDNRQVVNGKMRDKEKQMCDNRQAVNGKMRDKEK